MDPVQLMMAAHQADAAVAAQTPDQALQAAIAQSRPDLWAPLSTNPAAYPDLLGWLASTGNVEVLANLRACGYLTDDAAANAADAAGAAGTEGAVVTESADADESAEGAESAAEAAAGTDAEAQTTQDAADEAQEPGSGEPDDEAAGADDVAVPADEEPKADESTEAEDVEPVEPVNDDTTALSPASQWHEVDSADTIDVTASAQSAAVATGWTAGSAESVALPVPPPPSAEDIAAWAETPSGAPQGTTKSR